MRKCDAPHAHLAYKPCYSSPFAIFLSEAICRKKSLFGCKSAAKHLRAWNHIRNDARLSADLRALTDPKMPGHSRLPALADEIFRYG